jgi:prolipoprotein diacylglyceryl transferase
VPAAIPSPSSNGVHFGPALVHFYGLCYVVAIAAVIALTRRRWRAQDGDPDLVYEVALYGVPAGILGARLYHDITSWNEVPHTWWGWLAIWQGGLGVWGGIAAGTLAGLWVLRRRGVDLPAFLDAAAPGLLVAQAIGRVGNYFNQELFGGPTSLPWGLEIDAAHRPAGYLADRTFHPTFLYELLWDLLLAAGLIWLGKRRSIRAPGLFALYVAGYSAFRIFEELLRVDPSHHLLGLRLNLYVAAALTLAGLLWFRRTQRPGEPLFTRRDRTGSLLAAGWATCAMAGCGHGGAPARARIQDARVPSGRPEESVVLASSARPIARFARTAALVDRRAPGPAGVSRGRYAAPGGDTPH